MSQIYSFVSWEKIPRFPPAPPRRPACAGPLWLPDPKGRERRGAVTGVTCTLVFWMMHYFVGELQKEQERFEANGGFRMRMGINTGPVAAGVIGLRKFLQHGDPHGVPRAGERNPDQRRNLVGHLS
jgi:Adenylate and Guanylate cyclase catalytic domain